jgi:hypothetical protein
LRYRIKSNHAGSILSLPGGSCNLRQVERSLMAWSDDDWQSAIETMLSLANETS